MLEFEFCILDVDYKIISGKPSVILYGRDRDGKRVVVIDQTYEPYFYVLASDIERAKKDIRAILAAHNVKIKRIEIVEKNLFGEIKDFLKICCFLPHDVYRIRDLVKILEKKRGGKGSVIDEYEYQMSFYRKYLVDKGISCLDWVRVKGLSFKLNFDADEVVNAIDIEKKNYLPPYDFKIIAFDVEVVEEKGERKLIMVSLFSQDLKKIITYKSIDFPNTEVVGSEKELIEKFVHTIKCYDPDIIAGFNSDGYDFEVIKERAERLKVNLGRLSLDNSGLSYSKRARNRSFRIKGRVHIDNFNFISNILSSILQTEVLSLNAVAREILGDEKIDMEYSDILAAWREEKELERLAQYCLKDSELTFRLTKVLLPHIYQLTQIVGQTLFDTSRMTYSQLVEWYYTKEAKRTNRIIPNQPKFEEIQKRSKETYIGGYVKEPEAGLQKNLAVIDFASLYPSIISTYNISIETLNCSCCKEDGYKVPDLGYWFCKRKDGFEPKVIKKLLVERQELKEKLKNLNPQDLDYILTNTRQRALKTIANASYGYYAFSASKWYSKECAESITSFGRYWIKMILKKAEEKGFRPIYGDTDSAFLLLGDRDRVELLRFLEEVNKNLPGIIRIELENFYPRGIFIPKETGSGIAKKRYALIDDNDNLKIRGLERVRRDWSNVAKRIQENILKIILKEENLEKAIRLVKENIKALRDLNVDLKDLVVYEQITKPLKEYKLISPHICAAKRLVEKGIPVNPGSIIGFVIKKGGGSISEKAYPVEFVDPQEIDIDYYIYHQILPASLRILRVLGVDEDKLLD